MDRLSAAVTLLLVAAPVFAASSGTWAGICADSSCSRQGTVNGPTSIAPAPLWNVSTSTADRPIVGVTAVAFKPSGNLLVSADSSCQKGICFATTTLDASSGAQSLIELYDSTSYATTYQYGVPAVLTPGPSGVIVSGHGWQFDNGSYTGALFGADSASGTLLWSMVMLGGLFGDLATITSTDGSSAGEGLVYALWSENNTLLVLNVTSGAVVSSLAMGPPGHGPRGPSEILERKITLSADGAHLFLLDNAGGVDKASAARIDVSSGTPVVAWDNAGFAPATLSTGVAKLAADASTASLLLANVTGLSALLVASGSLAWSSPFPDVISDYERMSLAVDRAADGAAFVFASQALPDGGVGSGVPVLYAYNKATGALLARTDFNATQDYIKWGTSMVLDAAGGALFMSLLGPNVAPPPAQGGSVYLARVPFAGGAFGDAEISVLSPALQAGFPLLAVGPSSGQLTVAVGDAVGVIA